MSNPTTITSTNDLGTFLLNGLTLGGATANYGPVTFNITGGTLDFVANGSTDPTIDLAGTSSNGSSSLLTYNISSAVNFAADTTITNTATSTQAAFYQFSGPHLRQREPDDLGGQQGDRRAGHRCHNLPRAE